MKTKILFYSYISNSLCVLWPQSWPYMKIICQEWVKSHYLDQSSCTQIKCEGFAACVNLLTKHFSVGVLEWVRGEPKYLQNTLSLDLSAVKRDTMALKSISTPTGWRTWLWTFVCHTSIPPFIATRYDIFHGPITQPYLLTLSLQIIINITQCDLFNQWWRHKADK